MQGLPGDDIDCVIDLMMREKFSQTHNNGEVRLDPGEVEIRRLTSKLKSDNEEESKKAIWSVANLAKSPHNRKMIISEGALPLLISFLSDKMETRKTHVLSILTDLSQTALHRKEIVSANALVAVLALMKTSKPTITEHSVEFLANMCLNKRAKELISIETGILDILTSLTKKSNEIVKEHVFRVFVHISEIPEVAVELLKLGCVKSAIDSLMTSDNWVLKTSVAKVITHLSRDVKNLSYFGFACAWQLLELLDARSPNECRYWALEALSNLTQKETLRRGMFRQGGIPLITSHVRHNDRRIALMAVRCIANLTKDIDKVAICLRKGVIKILVELLEEKNHDALTTVANISEIPEHCLNLLHAGVVPHLVSFLKSEYVTSQLDTLRCLAHISDIDKSISWFLDMSVISSVVSSLRSSCLLSCSYAARIIRNISESNQGVRLIVESDAIWLLVRLLRCQSKTTILSATRALAVLSTNRNARALINQFDGVTDLLRFLKQGSDETKIHAAKALYDLSSCMEVQRYIACEGGITTLIGMLNSQTFEVRENALCLLVRLGMAKDHWSAIRDGGGVGPLLKQLLASEVRDAVGVCQSFVKFFNAVILTLVRGRISVE